MNTLTIIVLLIFFIFILLGYKRGLFRSAFRLVLGAVSILLSYFLAPIVAGLIINYTNVDNFIHDKIYVKIETVAEEKIREQLQSEMGVALDAAGNALIDQMVYEALQTEPTKNQQIQMIQSLEIPAFITNALLDNNHQEVKEGMGVKSFYDYIATYISYMIVNAIAFLVTTFILGILFTLIFVALSVAVKLPIVNIINRLGGMLFGCAEALLFVWVLFVFVAIFSGSGFGELIYNQVNESRLLSILYDKNILTAVITDLTKIL